MTNRGPFAPGLPPWSSKDSFARMAPTGKGNVPLSAATSAFRFTKVNTCRLPCVALSTGASFTFRHVLYRFAVAVATGSCPGTGCAASAHAVRTPATARAIRSLGTMRHPPVGAYFAGEETGRPVRDIPRLRRARARGKTPPGEYADGPAGFSRREGEPNVARDDAASVVGRRRFPSRSGSRAGLLATPVPDRGGEREGRERLRPRVASGGGGCDVCLARRAGPSHETRARVGLAPDSSGMPSGARSRRGVDHRVLIGRGASRE